MALFQNVPNFIKLSLFQQNLREKDWEVSSQGRYPESFDFREL